MRKLNWKSDWFVGLMITLMFLIFAETQLFESLDNQAYHLGVSFSSDKKASEDIVIIAIDDKSLQALGAWPWSRDVLAKITRLLGKYRPRVFGFTMPFDMAQNQASLASVKNLRKTLKKELKLSPGVNKELKKTEMTRNIDETLAASFDSAGRIVLAIPYIAANEPIADESKPLPAYMQKFILRNVTARDDTSGMEWLWPNPNITRAGALFPPIEVLARQAEGVGMVSFNDSINREPLIVSYGQDFLPSFPLMLVTRSKGISMKHIVSRRGAKPMLGGKELDADIDFNIYPRFYEGENG
ncbi:MAG: CHASE2 domain-containing protein, partial [Gammaproteobacteria bacterium]|nr:CHASE2 domain-containing protein [Gammaproteobacteria bacterium]